MIGFVDNLFQPAAFPSGSPIVRPSCPFQNFGSPESSAAGILFGSDFSPWKYSCQMRSGPVTMMRAPTVSAFETRLGPRLRQAADAEISETAGELNCSEDPNPVLIVVDANKEMNTNALDWALSYVVQKGDSVKLLGVLHHILNPSKFWAAFWGKLGFTFFLAMVWCLFGFFFSVCSGV